jgi:hypothetical protein
VIPPCGCRASRACRCNAVLCSFVDSTAKGCSVGVGALNYADDQWLVRPVHAACRMCSREQRCEAGVTCVSCLLANSSTSCCRLAERLLRCWQELDAAAPLSVVHHARMSCTYMCYSSNSQRCCGADSCCVCIMRLQMQCRCAHSLTAQPRRAVRGLPPKGVLMARMCTYVQG